MYCSQIYGGIIDTAAAAIGEVSVRVIAKRSSQKEIEAQVDVSYEAFWDYVGFGLILLSWAVLPGIFVWWESARRRLVDSLGLPEGSASTRFAFMPFAPVLSTAVFVCGLIPAVVTLGSDARVSFALELGFFSVAFWGLVSTFASTILWTHLPE